MFTRYVRTIRLDSCVTLPPTLPPIFQEVFEENFCEASFRRQKTLEFLENHAWSQKINQPRKKKDNWSWCLKQSFFVQWSQFNLRISLDRFEGLIVGWVNSRIDPKVSSTDQLIGLVGWTNSWARIGCWSNCVGGWEASAWGLDKGENFPPWLNFSRRLREPR